jgi:hypothetical protein
MAFTFRADTQTSDMLRALAEYESCSQQDIVRQLISNRYLELARRERLETVTHNALATWSDALDRLDRNE